MQNKTRTNKKEILIVKASGEKELFSLAKLKRSLTNAGAKEETINQIALDIKNWIYEGVSTKEIYHQAFSLLQEYKTPSALRYKLKQAIYELGPTGYPFESLIGQLFERQGFQTEVGVVVDGRCVTHEMDVIATKENEQHLVECKYHKDQGKQVSIQVPLYVRSRVDDIVLHRKEFPEYSNFNFIGWVVTNTRFSSDSIQYGECCGLKLMAWDYPKGNGLKDLLEKLKIYPITILHNLTTEEKQKLMENNIVTCAQISDNKSLLKSMGFTAKKYAALLNEFEEIHQ